MSPVRTLGFAVAAVAASVGSALAQETAVIGVAAPMTGPLAPLGRSIDVGVRAAVEQINAAGGVRGMTLVVETIDDGCAEDRGTAVANQFAGAGALLVVGPMCSAPAISAAAVYNFEGIIVITPSAPDPRVTDNRPGPGLFRLGGRSDDQAEAAVAYLAAASVGAVIAVVDDRTSYGRMLSTGVREALDRLAVASVTQTYSRAETSPAVIAERLVALGVGSVFAAGDPAEMAALRTALIDAGFTGPFMTGDAAADPAFAAAAGDAADGTLFVFPADPALLTDAEAAIVEIEALGDRADGFALFGFAAVEIWADAAQAAETVGFAAVASAISTGRFATTLGEVGFDDKGDVDRPAWLVFQWDGNIYSPAPLPPVP